MSSGVGGVGGVNGVDRLGCQTCLTAGPVSWDRWTCVLGPLDLCPGTAGPVFEPWCVEVSTVSTVSTECRGGVEGVSVDTSVDGVEGVNGVSKAILTSGML